MTDTTPSGAAPFKGLDGKILLSRWALALERIWPRLWLPVGVFVLFFVASLAGLWPLLSAGWHVALLAGFGLAALVSILPLIRVRWPSRAEALSRLEAQSGLPHRPASSYDDTLSPATETPTARSLWEAHRRRLARLIDSMRPKAPRPRTEPSDPFAVRALMLLALTGLLAVAGDAYADRLASAFRFGPAVSMVPTRLDAWVTPPAYTGKQPFLIADGSQPMASDEEASRRFDVPEGSQLLIRAAGPAHGHFAITRLQGSVPAEQVPAQTKADPATPVAEFKLTLIASQTVRVADSGIVRQSWAFAVTPDQPPAITLSEPPKQGARGALLLEYRVTDDYGVANAEAAFELAEPAKSKPLKLADGTEIGPMGDPPTSPLKLPKAASAKDIKGKTSVDLTAHPWAGLKVKMTLRAKDRANHLGTSVPPAFDLPERQFQNPLARAIIEQRRTLAFSPGSYLDVRFALDALAIAPDKFPIEPAAYLMLRSAYRQLKQEPSKELFQTVADQLWQLALRIESGNLSEAERALKDAEDRLAKALEEGASDAELQKLMAELRQAMSKFLRELAEQGQRQPQQQSQQNGQSLNERDLQQMLKQMEDMAKSGNKDAAQQMLSQLRDLLDRLQSGKMAGKGQGQDGQNGQMRQLMDKFGNLIGKQKKLLDETFKQGRGQRGSEGEQGQSGEGEGGSGERQLDGLGDRQGELRNDLDRLMQDLKGLGGKQPDQLDDAGRSMGDAQDSLKNEDTESAADAQGRALDQLRKGAQSMVEEMMKGQQGQANGNRAGSGERDPLGRQLTDPNEELGSNRNMLPNELAIQRSRRIIEELRRRLGETTRPPGELDYLERLLK
jgi:uncharacterized protein (TIGR02302 family)